MKTALTPQQLAAMEAQFSRTIAQAQRSIAEVPPQRRSPARAPEARPYEAIMSGTPEQFLSAFQGDCTVVQTGVTRGPVHSYYIRCMIRYNDGFFENVSYPWLYHFPANQDPFEFAPGTLRFGPQPPPAGFTLPPNFALSRAVCTFFHDRCADVIARERANGNQPATAP